MLNYIYVSCLIKRREMRIFNIKKLREINMKNKKRNS